jgi:hypothetical protein
VEDFIFKIAERFGVSVGFGALACLFFYFKIWPLLERVIFAHLDFVAACDASNKSQNDSLEKIAAGQKTAIEKIDDVHKSQKQVVEFLRPRSEKGPGWGV